MAPTEPAFVPILAQVLPSLWPEQVPAPARAMNLIEIELSGAELRVAPGTDAALLSMVPRISGASA